MTHKSDSLRGWGLVFGYFCLLILIASISSCSVFSGLSQKDDGCPFRCATLGCNESIPEFNIPVVAFEERIKADSTFTIYVRFHFDKNIYTDSEKSRAAVQMLSDANDLFRGLIHFTLPNDNMYYTADIGKTIEYYNYDIASLHELSIYADDNMINVYIVESEGRLNGFTMLPSDWMDFSDQRWNTIFLAADAYDKGTFGHELGHYFGLRHVRYDYENPNCDLVNDNIMSYLSCRDRFIDTQFDTIVSVLVEKRNYLIR